MMAHSSRDPVFQAKFASELARNPRARSAVLRVAAAGGGGLPRNDGSYVATTDDPAVRAAAPPLRWAPRRWRRSGRLARREPGRSVGTCWGRTWRRHVPALRGSSDGAEAARRPPATGPGCENVPQRRQTRTGGSRCTARGSRRRSSWDTPESSWGLDVPLTFTLQPVAEGSISRLVERWRNAIGTSTYPAGRHWTDGLTGQPALLA